MGGMVKVGTAKSGWSGAQPDGRCVYCLPLLIFPCITSPEVLLWHRLTWVAPEKRAVKWLCVCVVG